MSSIKIISIIIITLYFSANLALAGTLMLMGVGLPTTGGGPPPVCSNSLDFSDACNSQYFPAVFQ